MKIGEAARSAGVNASALRYYEQEGLIAARQRVGGQRRYSDDAVHRVRLIRFSGSMGFSLPEIRMFLSGLDNKTPVGPRWRKLAKGKIEEMAAAIERCRQLKKLLEHLLHCRCASLPDCVERLQLNPVIRAQATPFTKGLRGASAGRKRKQVRIAGRRAD